MAIRNSLIEAYGLNSPGVNLLDHAGNHDYQSFGKANDNENTQIVYDNINNYVSVTQPEDTNFGIYRILNSIIIGGIYNLSFYAYSDTDCDFLFGIASASEVFGSSLHVNAGEWTKCWCVGKASNTTIAFYTNSPSFKIRNVKFTKCSSTDCYFLQYTDINDELKPFVYNFKDLQTNCRYTEYFTDDNPINELISWENFKYLLKEFVEYEKWQYSDDKSYRTRNTISIIDWCDGSNKSSVSNIEREDATIEYGTPELTLVVNDIPASGGTISDGTVSYGQSKYYVYSDARFKVTDESGVITDGLIWGDPVTAQSLGTTIKDRSIVGSLSVSTTINGKTESTTVDVYQQANKIESYGTPTGRTLSVSDIPASGGTISRGTLGGTITQSCTYTSGSNGTLTNPTITSSSYSASITAGSLGTTIKDRTKVGTLTYTYVCNKKTGSISADVYQQANNATDITYGDWSVSLSANKYTTSSSPAPASGGTAAITSSASRSRIQNYTSGATSKLSNETAPPSLNVTGSGFTLSESNVIISNRTNEEGASRTGSVTATYNGVSKSIALYQAENKLVAVSANGVASIGTVLNIYASGGKVTWSPVVEYSSGWSGTPPSGVTITYSVSGDGATQSSNITTWVNRGSIIGSWRGADVTLSAKSSYTTNPINGIVSTGQNMNTITSISIVGGDGEDPRAKCPANGGICEIFPKFTFSSGDSKFSLEYSKLGNWSGAASGFTITNVDASSSSGINITAASRGTSIGNERSITVTYILNTTINRVAINKSATHKYTQSGNYISSINVIGSSFSYPNISAGATSASPTFSGGSVTYTFSSGSTSTIAPSSTYGSYSVVTTYSLGSVINGFTTVNSSSGLLTATSRGTTIGPARTSGIVTKTTKGTWTPSSSYNSAGTKTDTDTKTATCTQALNKVVSVTETGNTLSYPNIAAAGGTSTPSSTATVSFKYSSGSTGTPSGYTSSSSHSMTAGNGFSINTSTGVVTATNNTTTSSRTSNTITRTTKFSYTNPSSVGGDTVSATLTKTATCTQSAGYKSYANPVVSLSYSDIPASGGAVSPTYSYSQTWGWNGATSGGGTITSGGTLKWTGCTDNTTGRCSATSKGTVVSARNSVTGSATLIVTLNGKSGSKSTTVYQALNTITALTMMSGINIPVTTSYTAAGGKNNYTMDATYSSGSRAQAGSNFASYIDYSFNQSWGTWTDSSSPYYGSLTVPSRGITIGAARSGVLTGKLIGTINGVSINKSATATITQLENTVTSSKIVPISGSASDINFPASEASRGFIGELTLSSGSKIQGADYRNYITYSLTSSFGTFTPNAEKYYGIVTVASRGTTIGAQKSGTLTHKISGTINGVSINKTATLGLTQALNKMTALAIIPSVGSSDTTSYPSGNFAASGGTKTPTKSSRVNGTFSSGSHGYTDAAGAWYGGTLTMSRTWSMATASGFSINTSTGVVTAASRGTTIGAARTCNPKCVISASYTNPSSVGGGVVKASSVTDSFTLTQAANSMTREYSNLSGHISSTTWANKANYTNFWAEGSYTEKYTSGTTGSSGSGEIPWDSVTFGGADWVYYDSVQGILKWYDNTGLERSTTITGKIGDWTYSVKVTQKAGMIIGRLYLHVPVNIGYVEYWNIYVNSTSGGEIWSGHPDMYGSANNILKMPEECAIIVAQNGGTVSFSTTYSTATDRTYRGSISGTEQDRLADGEDITVYLT